MNAIYQKNGKFYTKKLSKKQYTINKKPDLITKSYIVTDKEALLKEINPHLKNIGVDTSQMGQDIWSEIFCDYFSRNKKYLKFRQR